MPESKSKRTAAKAAKPSKGRPTGKVKRAGRAAAAGGAASVVVTPAPPLHEPAAIDDGVLVVGDHPAAALCALLLKEAKVNVALLDVGTTPGGDRLVTLNPDLFRLHKALEPLRRSLDLVPLRFAQFLGPGGEMAASQPKRGDGKAKNPEVLAYVGSMREVRDAFRALAVAAEVPTIRGPLVVETVDERGVHVRIAGKAASPRLLAVADPLPEEATGPLQAPRFPGRGSSVQATAWLAGKPLFGPSADPEALPLSLDLGRQLQWGWLLRRREEVQLCVQCPPEADVIALMEEWAETLRRQGIIAPGARPDPRTVQAEELPFGGALTRDVVARRTILFGPAGGFYSASGEDVYPACWSAKYAAEIAAKAAKADHPQDALGGFRGRWGATLGDYLRGPQQNLRFLLPLVYKNPVMTDRLVDAILLGEGLVK